jgi:DNA (cytosine-5)-methyltransferase 1
VSGFDAVDLFAGPGGWDVGAQELGIRTIGLEWDADACDTRRAADLPTVEGDVRKFGPANFPNVRGLIASPPCQTFSTAGKGSGRAALDLVLEQMRAVVLGGDIDYSAFSDERTGLVLEPLRWALEGDYDWIAFEQVPAVLPVWEAAAIALRMQGYSADTGILRAEQYGVPQTRKRAFLVAHRHNWRVRLPAATHRPYKKGVAQTEGDPALRPWVSMADALGWPEGLVGFPRLTDGRGDVVSIGGQDYRGRDFRRTAEPAFVLTEKARSWKRLVYVNGTHVKAGRRPATTPAPTVMFGASLNTVTWRDQDEAHAPLADHHRRVTVQEAAVLQSFPAWYPWQGSKTSQFLQVGNAVPPQLAGAVLQAVTQQKKEQLAA